MNWNKWMHSTQNRAQMDWIIVLKDSMLRYNMISYDMKQTLFIPKWRNSQQLQKQTKKRFWLSHSSIKLTMTTINQNMPVAWKRKEICAYAIEERAQTLALAAISLTFRIQSVISLGATLIARKGLWRDGSVFVTSLSVKKKTTQSKKRYVSIIHIYRRVCLNTLSCTLAAFHEAWQNLYFCEVDSRTSSGLA